MLDEMLGPYRIESELGSGGMGKVYLAEVVGESATVPSGTSVAVNMVHPHLLAQPGFFKRFMREAEVGRPAYGVLGEEQRPLCWPDGQKFHV